ncbi:MAG TPA: hypothetical protein VH251_04055 [Verrucomicrobiae bacterium]|nr:hypothetical protein [Verrucomicrobiae bacterium]
MPALRELASAAWLGPVVALRWLRKMAVLMGAVLMVFAWAAVQVSLLMRGPSMAAVLPTVGWSAAAARVPSAAVARVAAALLVVSPAARAWTVPVASWLAAAGDGAKAPRVLFSSAWAVAMLWQRVAGLVRAVVL